MTKITFPLEPLLALAQHAMAAPKHTFGYDVLFEPKYHKGGKVAKKDGWPDNEQVLKGQAEGATGLEIEVTDTGFTMEMVYPPKPARRPSPRG